MEANKTCRTCKDNDNGLCDRTGQLIDDDDHCDSWHSDWRDAMMRTFLGRPGARRERKMREILFKAKRIDDGKWVEGYYQKRYGLLGNEEHLIFHADSHTVCEYSKIDPKTLCQYTGLTDKNGNKIWENDIIKYHFGEIYAPIKYGYYQNCFDSQKTEHVGFYVDWTGDKCLRKDLGYWIDMVYAMPVGNIFDNKELLQEETE